MLVDDEIAALLGDAQQRATCDDVASETELAAWLGVSPRTVRELARKGHVQRAEPRGYALQQSVARYCAHLREAAAARSEDGTLAAERLRLTAERADEAALKNARLRGELLDARQVEADWSDVLRTVRARVLAVPARVEAKTPEASREALQVMKDEITNALTELGGGDN